MTSLRDHITLGSTPCDEPCAQVGKDDYEARAQAECRAFIHLTRATLGTEPRGADLDIRGFQHDYGTYFEVVVYFDGDDRAATQYAYRCEADAPTRWPAGTDVAKSR